MKDGKKNKARFMLLPILNQLYDVHSSQLTTSK